MSIKETLAKFVQNKNDTEKAIHGHQYDAGIWLNNDGNMLLLKVQHEILSTNEWICGYDHDPFGQYGKKTAKLTIYRNFADRRSGKSNKVDEISVEIYHKNDKDAYFTIEIFGGENRRLMPQTKLSSDITKEYLEKQIEEALHEFYIKPLSE